ncbi:MAG: hypothetical protein KGY60_01545 [Bacteroidales bacterium]|nr:hypothetical protein [Bacteroidales bacterium]
MINRGTISGDIISYTSLSVADKRRLEGAIQGLLSELSHQLGKKNFLGRLVQGDHIECALMSAWQVLRTVLVLKTYIKSLDIPEGSGRNKRLRLFKEHGVRLAAAVAPLDAFDPRAGIIDGEAIQLSGRTIQNQDTSGKQNIIIKKTLFFRASDPETEEHFEPVFALLDTLLSKCTAKQCQVVYLKLMGLDEGAIADKLNKYRSTINEHSTAAGWHAIKTAVEHFENRIR